MIITIDGPTASGKSTVAQLLAKKLGFYYLNTGALYRTVSYLLVTRCGYTEQNLAHVKEKDVRLCVDLNLLVYSYSSENGYKVFYDSNDITSFLKDCSVDRFVAIISPIPFVRLLVTEVQHAFAKKFNTIIEGRDSGSVVFPHADYKFYLTADLAVRAARWQIDQQKRGNVFTLSQAMKLVEERDIKDLSRHNSPLIIPSDAHILDNTKMSLEDTVEHLYNVICQ
ncbi:(d)CMP kinase [bacterium]|nr:(d)CMP kinase [bacterium]